jgi:type III restriction enzyme
VYLTGRNFFYDFWTHPRREKCLFFCQIEALETVIYLAEVVTKYGDAWIENTIG